MNASERGLPVLVGVLGVLFGHGCASAPPASPVRVYQTDRARGGSARRLPDGCRLLGASAPVEQMESERHGDDPYRVERRKTADAGGNVLLVLSEPLVVRPSSDCPGGDRSANCLRGAESWYRVVFESYACAPETLASLPDPWARARRGVKPRWEPPRPAAVLQTTPTPGSTETGSMPATESTPAPKSLPAADSGSAAISPDEMKRQILAMKAERIGVEVIVAYVRRQRLARALTADEIIDWKRAGIEDEVLAAAAQR